MRITIFLLIFAIGMSTAQARSTKKSTCLDLPEQLSTMVSVDQSLRDRWDYSNIPRKVKSESELPRVIQQTNLVDRVNTLRLTRIVEDCGWPKKSVYGEQTVGNAWLLAQFFSVDRARGPRCFAAWARALCIFFLSICAGVHWTCAFCLYDASRWASAANLRRASLSAGDRFAWHACVPNF